jgi:hypothetical protein
MGCVQSAPGLHAYYSPTGLLISYERPKKHSARREYQYVSSQDAKRFQADDDCYLLCISWHKAWLNYALKRTKVVPRMIENYTLLDGKREQLRTNVMPKKDFRPINKAVWEYLFHQYGGGPVITFKVPGGFTEEDYLKGWWMRKVVFEQVVIIIHPGPSPVEATVSIGESTRNPLSDDNGLAANVNIAANLMLRDLGKAKFEKAKAVQTEINAYQAENAAILMNKDRGSSMLAEGLMKEKEANQALSESIAHQMAEASARQKLKKDTKEIKAKAEASANTETLAVMAQVSLKKQFQAALKTKNFKLQEELAARMLQNAWEGKRARVRVTKMKEEKQYLLEDGYARKLQSRYRAYLAKKRVMKLRAEKKLLKDEGAAIIVQSAWRACKARQHVMELKVKKQCLLEEGAALKLQSAWRIRQAKPKLKRLKSVKTEEECKRKLYVAHAKKVIGRLIIANHARLRYKALLQQSRHVFIVHLHRAHNVLIADVNSSDPYVLCHVDNDASLFGNANALSTGKPRVKSSSFTDSGRTLSLFKSKVQYNTLNPIWNEDCLAVMGSDPTNSNVLLSSLIITVMDKDNYTSDDFLGQAIVSVQQHAEKLYNGQTVVLSLPLGAFRVPLRDVRGKRQAIQNIENNPGKGTIDLSIRLARPSTSHHGWMQRKAVQRMSIGLGLSVYKPRFLVLAEGKLSYHDDELSLDSPRGTIVCKNVNMLSYGPDKHGETTLHIKAGDKEWALHWMEGEKMANILAWLRKLQYNCPHAVLNNETGRLLQRIEALPKYATMTTPKKSSASNSTRRGSAFLGNK